MGNENVELLWCVFCLIKAVILLFVFFAVALLCKWLLRCIPWKSVKRRPVKHAMVHSIGTLRPPRNFDELLLGIAVKNHQQLPRSRFADSCRSSVCSGEKIINPPGNRLSLPSVDGVATTCGHEESDEQI